MKKLFLGLFTSHAGGVAGAGLEALYLSEIETGKLDITNQNQQQLWY
jgi:hypothetical protein